MMYIQYSTPEDDAIASKYESETTAHTVLDLYDEVLIVLIIRKLHVHLNELDTVGISGLRCTPTKRFRLNTCKNY